MGAGVQRSACASPHRRTRERVSRTQRPCSLEPVAWKFPITVPSRSDVTCRAGSVYTCCNHASMCADIFLFSETTSPQLARKILQPTALPCTVGHHDSGSRPISDVRTLRTDDDGSFEVRLPGGSWAFHTVVSQPMVVDHPDGVADYRTVFATVSFELR